MITIVPIRLNVRRVIIYLQTVISVHSVRKIHIALGEYLTQQTQILV